MKSLTNKQLEQLSDYQEKFPNASQRVESAIADFNMNMLELWSDLVSESINEYNDLVNQAQEFLEVTCDRMQHYYEEKSEKWHHSETGEAYQQWIDDWEEAKSELEEIDLTMPSETDVPKFFAVEAIDGLSGEPS